MAHTTVKDNQMDLEETLGYAKGINLNFECPRAMVISNNSQYAYIGKNCIIKLCLNSAKIISKFNAGEAFINVLALSNDDLYLAAGEFEGRVVVYDTESKAKVLLANETKSFVAFLRFLPNSISNLLVGFQDNLIEIWNVHKKSCKKINYPNMVCNSALSNDGKNLWVVGEDKLTLFDIERDSNKTFDKFDQHYNVQYTHDETRLILTNWVGVVTVFNIQTKESNSFNDSSNDGWLNFMSISSDDHYVAVSGASKFMFVYDLFQMKLAYKIERNCTTEVKFLFFCHQNRHIISSCDSVYVCTWDLANGDKRIIGEHRAKITNAEMAPNKLKFVTGGLDGFLLWDAINFVIVGRVDGHCGDIFGAALSIGKDFLVTSGEDYYIKFWDLNNRREIRSIFTGKEVEKLKLTPNKFVAVACDNQIYVYKLVL